MNIAKSVSQTFTFTESGSQNIDLGATVAVNLIQSICVNFSSVSIPVSANSFVLGAFDGSLTLNDFYANPGIISSGYTVTLDRTSQIISSLRYIQFGYQTDAVSPSDTVTISISYFQIPTSQQVSGNFLSSSGSSADSTLAILNGPSTGCYNVKSVWVINLNAVDGNFSFSLLQNSIAAPLCKALSLTSASTVSPDQFRAAAPFISNYSVNLSLTNGTSLILNNLSSQPFEYYVSYTYQALDT